MLIRLFQLRAISCGQMHSAVANPGGLLKQPDKPKVTSSATYRSDIYTYRSGLLNVYAYLFQAIDQVIPCSPCFNRSPHRGTLIAWSKRSWGTNDRPHLLFKAVCQLRMTLMGFTEF
jgi:hypothetical protein